MAKRRGYRPPVELGRKEQIRADAERILIVCEGECTEPFYLDDLRRDLHLSSVEVRGKECGSDPASVVNYAIERYRDDEAIDKIYCLIDRDEHQTFERAFQLARQAQRDGVPITLMASYPCFEFWYLLHYTYTRAPIVRSSGRSPGQNTERALRDHLEGYSKNRRDMWSVLREKVPTAIKHARRASGEARADSEVNPSTEVHKLVAHLRKIAATKDPE